MLDATAQLSTERAALLIVDLQEKLLPAMHDAANCVAAASRLLSAADVLGVPVVVTEQYPQGLGLTCPEIRGILNGRPAHAKTLFSACVPPVISELRAASRTQVIIAGVEAHVCVQQTVLDLIRAGMTPWVCADAISSRRPLDMSIALDRMRQAGAVVTTSESVIYELLREAGTPAFKAILKIVK